MEHRLGRGLGSLLGGAESDGSTTPSGDLPVANIRPNPFQPRRQFDEAALQELAQSLREHGLLQPLVVRKAARGFELVSGERRWRAARLIGMETVPAIVRPRVSDQEMLELALVENVQRQDLNAIERAQGFRSLMDALGLNAEAVAQKVGLQRASVANHLRLLDLPQQVQDAVSNGMLTMGHARAILTFGAAADQIQMMERSVREGLSVREVERLGALSGGAKRASRGSTRKSIVPHQPWITEMEARLREVLGTRVAVENSRGYRGKIVIEYFDRPTLERLVSQLAPKPALAQPPSRAAFHVERGAANSP